MALKRFKVEKIIRDHMPEIMRKKGIWVFERFLEEKEFVKCLQDKLQEEAKEVQKAENEEEMIEELADLLEVAYALAQASGINLEQIEAKRKEKREAKGGFDKRTYNPFIEIEESNPNIEYYLKKADHYPLIESTISSL